MSVRKRNLDKTVVKEPSVVEIVSKALKAESEWTDKVSQNRRPYVDREQEAKQAVPQGIWITVGAMPPPSHTLLCAPVFSAEVSVGLKTSKK